MFLKKFVMNINFLSMKDMHIISNIGFLLHSMLHQYNDFVSCLLGSRSMYIIINIPQMTDADVTGEIIDDNDEGVKGEW